MHFRVLAVSRSYCDDCSGVCRVFRREGQARKCIRSYNNELAALSIVTVIVGYGVCKAVTSS
jgi:hypothetical protein